MPLRGEMMHVPHDRKVSTVVPMLGVAGYLVLALLVVWWVIR